MPILRNLSGQRFGRLIVGSRVGSKNGHAAWLCLCDCGKETTVLGCHLTSNHTASCGCLHREVSILAAVAANKIHGHSGKVTTPEYMAWRGMIARCNNPKHISYKNYGAIGIFVCDEWMKSFKAFLSHIGHRPSPLHSVDRIKCELSYQPGNVRWATSKEQHRNRRNNRYIDVFGTRMLLAEAADIYAIDIEILRKRVDRGWPMSRALGLTP